MNPRRILCTASCLVVCALAATRCLSAQSASPTTPTTFEFSNCQSAQAASPDGKWTLAGVFVAGACPPTASNPQPGTRDPFAAAHANDYGVALWVEDALRHIRRAVDFLGYYGEVAWSPSGEAFFVNDHIASNTTDSWIYRTNTLERVNVRRAIRGADRQAAPYMAGHAYFRTRQWIDGRTAVVQLCGHTDAYPSQQFDLRYRMGLDGHTQRISTRVRAVTDENVQMECE